MQKKLSWAGIGLAAAALSSVQAQALPDLELSLYRGRGLDHRLLEIPGKVMGGKADTDPAHFAGVGVAGSFGTLGTSFPGLAGGPWANVRHGWEALVLKHWGMQDNTELAAAWTLRTRPFEAGPLRTTLGAGLGITHAVGRARYDDPTGEHRTLLLLLFEADWSLATMPHVALVTRLHHRSAVYGLLGPRSVGGNYATIGVRYRF